jgi:hypothetical protein
MPKVAKVTGVPQDHVELKRQLVAKYGSAKNVAKAVGKSLQTISGWGRTHPIPDPWPDILRGWLEGTTTTVRDRGEEWTSRAWRESKGAEKACQQIRKLWDRTIGHGREWATVISLLDLLEPWRERDWRELSDESEHPMDEEGS